MKSISTKIFIGLIIILSICAALNIYLPQGNYLSAYELPASKPVTAIIIAVIIILVYGGLGLIGLILSRKLGFAEIWDKKVSNHQRFLTPGYIGMISGVFFILIDSIVSKLHSLGAIPHPPFPTSIVASLSAGIGEEVIFRLFFISFWTWLISYVILKKRWQNQVFWIISIISALVFAFGHIPTVMIIYGLKSISQIPLILMAELVLLNGAVSMFAAYYFRKYGFLAAAGIHFWTDIVWHVIWGLI